MRKEEAHGGGGITADPGPGVMPSEEQNLWLTGRLHGGDGVALSWIPEGEAGAKGKSSAMQGWVSLLNLGFGSASLRMYLSSVTGKGWS